MLLSMCVNLDNGIQKAKCCIIFYFFILCLLCAFVSVTRFLSFSFSAEQSWWLWGKASAACVWTTPTVWNELLINSAMPSKLAASLCHCYFYISQHRSDQRNWAQTVHDVKSSRLVRNDRRKPRNWVICIFLSVTDQRNAHTVPFWGSCIIMLGI